MISLRKLSRFFAAAALAAGLTFNLGLAGNAWAQEPAGPVVVELYTSQGCSSCPPADRILGELAEDQGVVALSFHVDYWNYIGWQDPFSDAAYTARQNDYRATLGNRFIYTPQMVIDGRFDVVGSRGQEVRSRIEEAKGDAKVSLRLTRDRLVIPAGEAPSGGADIWLIFFDGRHETQVGAGENSGRKLVNSNVVRRMMKIGRWDGRALDLPLDAEAAAAAGRDGCAVLLQGANMGPIVGAAMLRFGHEG
jgi:hypothetical protein